MRNYINITKGIVVLLLFFVSFFAFSNRVAAGSVIGTGSSFTPGSSGAASGGVGTGICSIDGDAASCGTSWIYYQSTGNEKTAIEFTPNYLALKRGNTQDYQISAECSESGRGFWHYGRNGYAKHNVGRTGYTLDGNLVNVYKDPGTTYDYYAGKNKYGHADTYTWEQTIGYTDFKGQPFYQNFYKTYGNENLSHELYKNDTVIYKAVKYGSIEEVKENYKTACEYDNRENGNNNDCSDIKPNTTYFCYWDMEIPVTLSAKAVDASGKYIDGDRVFDSSTVEEGNSASVGGNKLPNINGYTFVGWRKTKDSGGYINTNTTYSETISENTVVYAVYEQDRTLTVYAGVNGTFNASTGTRTYLKSNGSTTSNSSESWTNSSTVKYNTNATVDTSSFNPAGYSWATWGSSCAESERDGRKCTKKNLTSNTNVFAYYDRNSFKARARVGNGTDWSKASYYKNSDYQTEGSAGTADIQCSSTGGCTVGFWFDLKAIAGNGPTVYSIQKRSTSKNSSGQWTWSNVTNYASKTSTPGTSGTNVYAGSLNIGIDSTVCYRIAYRPYGSFTNDTIKYVSACAHVLPSAFKGKTTMTGAANETAGYTSDTNPKSISKVKNIEKCSPTNGCKVTFKHYLQRVSGLGSTAYNVTRTSNLITSTKAISAGTIKGNTTFSSNSETVVSESTNLTLYPGMVICERMTFTPNNKSGTGNIYTQVCAHAHGNSQCTKGDSDCPDPDNDTEEYDGNSSQIKIMVKNNSVTKYNNYKKIVYAKPNDVLTYRATYWPQLQYTYYLAPQKLQIDGGAIYPLNGEINSSSLLWNYYNNVLIKSNSYKNKGYQAWNNDFSVQKGMNNRNFGLLKDYSYTNGTTDTRRETNDYKVTPNDVGNSVDEKAITNLNTNTKTTPSQVTFSDSNGGNLGNIVTSSVFSTAYARVPYNFSNSTEVLNNELYAYPGEQLTVKYTYNVGVRKNNETDGTYATKVANAKWKLQVCEGSCNSSATAKYTTDEQSGTANSSGNMDGVVETKSTTISIPDVAAGSSVCVRSLVYPQNSGAATNYTDKEGNHEWAASPADKEKCFTIAKKPSLEVWGGNVYSRGKITTSVSSKTHVAGVTNYNVNITANTPKYIFGSFGELGTIAGGAVSGFASGAASGFTENPGNPDLSLALWPSIHPANGAGNNANINGRKPGGSIETTGSFCTNRNPLTFANYPCNGAATGVIGNSIAANSAAKDKSSIISRFATGSDVNASGSITISNESENYNYSGNNDLIITSANLSRNASGNTNIKVVRSDKNITIAGNLIYDGTFTTLSNIPKLVVYADNIYINCSVTRIDALLIANNAVVTCNNLGNATTSTGTVRNLEDRATDKINDLANSIQLIVNGAIIADSITPNRTYGSATGANSIIPAEIINYDPSLYLWGGESVDIMNGGNSSLMTTYIKEAAPRY